MAFIDQFIGALTAPLFSVWQTLVENALGIIAAAVVVIIGFLIGSALGYLISKLLEHSKLDQNLEKIHIHDILGFIRIHTFLGLLFKWYITSLFLAASAALIPGESLAILVSEFALWIPSFLAGILIFACGLIFAEFVFRHFMLAKSKGLRLLGQTVKTVFVIIAGIIALDQMGVQISLASNIVLIVIGGIVLALSLAIGISGGLALKDEAHQWLSDVKKNIK